MTTELIDQGARRLAVPVGRATSGRALTRILGLKGSPGWIVEQNGVREWRFEGVLERDGETFLHGPAFDGRPLEQIVELPAEEALPAVRRLVSAIRAVAEAKKAWFPIESDAVVVGNDGVLFLPPAIFAEIRDLRPFEVNRNTFESINHPDLTDEPRAVYAAAAILYRSITGRFPVSGAEAEEMHEQARKREIPAPDRLVPEILPELSDLVMAGLGRARGTTVTLAEMEEKLSALHGRKLARALSAEERTKVLNETAERESDAARSYGRRVFWEKNWKLVAIITAVAIAGGAVLGSVLKNAMKPRSTHGYDAEKVVSTFFLSMNDLDHQTMQDCVTGSAGKGEINEATTLFVTSRVTLGYEGRSHIVSAAAWDKAGRPPLESPDMLYGATGLSVTEEQGEPAPIFRVTYDKWNPAQALESDSSVKNETPPQSEGHRVTDRVWMKRDHGDWVIARVDRVSADPLPAPTVTAAAQSQNGRLAPSP